MAEWSAKRGTERAEPGIDARRRPGRGPGAARRRGCPGRERDRTAREAGRSPEGLPALWGGGGGGGGGGGRRSGRWEKKDTELEKL